MAEVVSITSATQMRTNRAIVSFFPSISFSIPLIAYSLTFYFLIHFESQVLPDKFAIQIPFYSFVRDAQSDRFATQIKTDKANSYL